jgi:hypothetical protein
MAGLVPAILDFEASCLPQADRRSYPIEVAVGFPEDGEIRSWIIRPEPVWLAEWDWSNESEKLHGLSQTILLSEGRPRAQVAREVERAIVGRRLFSDNPSYEKYWLSVLLNRELPVEPLDALLAEKSGGGILGREIVKEATAAAERSRSTRHRAAPDVAFQLDILRKLAALTS